METFEISTAAATSTVMLVFSTMFAVIIALAALIGFFRRWKRSTVSLCRIILAVIIAAIIVVAVGTAANFGEQLSEFVTNEVQAEGEAPSQTAVWWIVSAIYSIAVPFIFVVIFVLIAQVLRIPAYFISKALHITKQDELERQKQTVTSVPANDTVTENAELAKPAAPVNTSLPPEDKTKKTLEQIGGALISALCAFIVICVCILPITGLICTVSDGLTEFSEAANDSDSPITVDKDTFGEIVIDGKVVVDKKGVVDPEALNATLKSTLEPVRRNFFVAASYNATMKLLYNNLTKVKIGDETVSFGQEIESFFNVASSAVYFVTDFANYGEKQIAAADKLADYLVKSNLHCQIAAEIFSSVAKSVEKPTDNEFLSALIETLGNTTKESVAEDVLTVRDIFKSAVKNNIPQAIAKTADKDDGYLDVIESINVDFVYDLMSAIKKNPDFSGLLSPALNYGAEAIAKSFNEESGKITVGVDLTELSDEQLKSESENIAALLANVKKIVISLKGIDGSQEALETIMHTDLAPLGEFIDRLQDSLLVGDGAKELLIVILRSDDLAENGMVDIFGVIADHIESGDEVSMKKVLVATKELVKVISDYQAGKVTEKELSESLKTVIASLDAETAAITNEIIPKVNARMVNGGDGANAEATEKLMKSFVKSLSSEEAKELSGDEEAFEKEVAAFDCIMDIINSITAGNGYSIEDAEKIIETVANSKIVTSAIVSVAYDENGNLTDDARLLKENITDEDRQKVASACENYYNKQKNEYSGEEIEKMKINLIAIASVFDNDVVKVIEKWN